MTFRDSSHSDQKWCFPEDVRLRSRMHDIYCISSSRMHLLGQRRAYRWLAVKCCLSIPAICSALLTLFYGESICRATTAMHWHTCDGPRYLQLFTARCLTTKLSSKTGLQILELRGKPIQRGYSPGCVIHLIPPSVKMSQRRSRTIGTLRHQNLMKERVEELCP